jgi:hypothetical protein
VSGARGRMASAAMASAALLGLAGGARTARAQDATPLPSFIEQVTDDPCLDASTFDQEDQSREAQHARRACRLQRLTERLAAERRARLLATEQRHVAEVQNWVETSLPSRVSRPLSVALFAGTGLSSYGVALDWAVLSRLELGVWLGGRGISKDQNVSSTGQANYNRAVVGAGGRFYFSPGEFSPFVGGGFAIARTDMQAIFNSNPSALVEGTARAHFLTAAAGLELARRALRISLEYFFSYAFYTQANDNDPLLTEDVNLRRVWQDSLDGDRHGLRIQVGYAF